MKEFKFNLLVCVCVVSMLLFTACKDKQKKVDQLKVFPSSLYFTDNDSETKTLDVTTNVSTWVFRRSAEWCHVRKEVNTLIVTVDENTTLGGSRKGTITVKAGNASPQTITVEQSGRNNNQSVRQIDPKRLKKIEYPALTAREGLGLTIPTPPGNEHPRLFFRKTDIPSIKSKESASLLKGCWDKVKQSANATTKGNLSQSVKHNFDLNIIEAVEAKAFMYAVYGDEKMGNEAVDIIFNMHNSLVINNDKNGVCRDIGRIILATAVVYDWCYDLIAQEEKISLIAVMESLATDMEIKWPRLVQSSITDHGTEAQLLRDMLACGIATYDEKPAIFQRAAGRIFAELIPAQDFGYQSGHHHQGSSYGPYRFVWEMYPTFLFDRMGYSDLNRPLQGKMPYYWIYMRRPDGQLFRDGDDFIETYTRLERWWTYSNIAYCASYYHDPLLMGEAIRQRQIDDGEESPLFNILLIDPSLSADNNLSALPLTKYFPSPFGGMIARTGWDTGVSLTSGTVVAEMRIGERFFGSHQHLNAGSFQIYYKGPLVVNSGMYEGTQGSWGSSHFKNYYIRTIAHNCMLVHNPSEIFRFEGGNVSNDGGQRIYSMGAENMTELIESNFKYGEVIAYSIHQKFEYSYLKGDITAAYTNKVASHKRAFVFMNTGNISVPAALIVHDYIVSSNASFKKTWLLHCVQEPTFESNVITIVRNQKGYNGKLVNTTLLPLSENTNLTKIGGVGKEFTVGGINYPQQMSSSNNSWDGAIWRVELSPVTASQADVFLNVMQVTDADNDTLLPVEAVETTQMTGVQIGDRIALFSKNGNCVNTQISLTISGSGTFKVLITDLEDGNWDISGPNSPGMIKSDNNLIYFPASAGKYTITKK